MKCSSYENQSVLSARGFGGVILCGLVSFGLAAQAWAQSATFTAQAYPLVGNTHIAADFNGDGKPDLAGSGLQAASVMLNNSNGTFGPKTDYPVGDYTQDVAAGDFNGDGKMDLVITIQSPQQSLAFLPGTGTGISARRRSSQTLPALTHHRCSRATSITTPNSMS